MGSIKERRISKEAAIYRPSNRSLPAASAFAISSSYKSRVGATKVDPFFVPSFAIKE